MTSLTSKGHRISFPRHREEVDSVDEIHIWNPVINDQRNAMHVRIDSWLQLVRNHGQERERTHVFSMPHGFDTGLSIIALEITNASCELNIREIEMETVQTRWGEINNNTYIIPSSRTFTAWVQAASVQKKMFCEGQG